jgi:hypothetical protein
MQKMHSTQAKYQMKPKTGKTARANSAEELVNGACEKDFNDYKRSLIDEKIMK